ncbi:mandelate racemase/muconate lactonizing enzyme family protein [Jiangella muralis]|uniref:mandelate racemase/muconate lactonizing enzyme family protein n=1 Tax=Jiangella muralis TaxID=702383 RepID=UPI00069F89D7|nr:mandelate racemase/muconate lactonizing enzyme family protein [Jiangella muralis]
MPTVENVGDGSQDVLLVRVRAGGWEGWGECEASPLVSIASLIAPRSHSACQPVLSSVLGQRIDGIDDVRRITALVRANSFDQLQAAHTLSGINIALCDLLGRRYEVPVHELLGVRTATPKTPYASTLFGSTPEETRAEAARLAGSGFRAVKFGWMGFGTGSVAADIDQLAAAREGVGPDADLLIDAAMAWVGRPDAARARVAALQDFRVRFIEEPFVAEEYDAYREFGAVAKRAGVAVAGGEGCHNVPMALTMMTHADLDYVQIDAGRIGGITEAKEVADAVQAQGRRFLNHSFTSHLALSASLQPFAGHRAEALCEYPVNSKPVSYDLTTTHLSVDADGLVRIPDAPGLGVTPDPRTISAYLQQVEISVQGQTLYRTPELDLVAADEGIPA